MEARGRSPLRSLVREGSVLLALTVMAAVVSNATASSQRRLAWIGDYPEALRVPSRGVAAPQTAKGEPATTSPQPALASAGKTFPPHPDKAAVEISSEDAALLHGRGALFIDARRSKVYEEGHIAGARSFPVWEADIDARVKGIYEEGLDQSAPVVVYCSGGNCEDSHMLAQKLYMVGFDNVLVYKDGFPDWESREGPIERGAAR